MNDDQLRQAIKEQLGKVPGPINDLTRDVYLRMLKKKPSLRKPQVNQTYRKPQVDRPPRKIQVEPTYPSEDESITPSLSRRSSISRYFDESSDEFALPQDRLTIASSPSSGNVSFENGNYVSDSEYSNISRYIPRKYITYRRKSCGGGQRQIEPIKPGPLIIDPTVLAFIGSGIIAAVLYALYLHNIDNIRYILGETLGIFDNALTKFLERGLTPLLLFATLGSFFYAAFRIYQIRQINKANYAAKRKMLVNKILKIVYDSGKNGIRVSHIRDSLMPPYRRTSDDIILWEDCKDCVKNNDSRIRAEERAYDDGEALEFFVWISNFQYSEK